MTPGDQVQGPWSGHLQLWFPILALPPPPPWWPGGGSEHCSCWAGFPSSMEVCVPVFPPPRETSEVTLTKVVPRTLPLNSQTCSLFNSARAVPRPSLFRSLFIHRAAVLPLMLLLHRVILIIGREGLQGEKELKVVVVGVFLCVFF